MEFEGRKNDVENIFEEDSTSKCKERVRSFMDSDPKRVLAEELDEKKFRQSQAFKKWYDQKGKEKLFKRYHGKEQVIQRKIKILEGLGYTVIPPSVSQ